MHTRFSLTFFLLFLLSLTIGAQEFPYELDWKQELSYFTTGASISLTSHLIESQLEGLGPRQLARQNANDVPFFDRGATRQFSENHRVLSDQLLKYSFLLPASGMLSRSARSKPLVLAVMLAETGLLTEGFTKMSKVIFRRARPLTYNPEFENSARQSDNARQSFVSGHTANSAAMSFFTAKVFHDLYPDSKLRPLFWAGAAAVPLVTGYARYKAGKHFPTDIAAGMALGAAIGILIPEWHKKQDRRGLRVMPSGTGVSLSYSW